MANTTHAGHGGKGSPNSPMDPGAVGSGTTEHKEMLQVNSEIQKATKWVDTTDKSGSNVPNSLSNIVNNVNKVATSSSTNVSNHLNAFNNKATGAEVWYYLGDSKGKALAEKVSASIAKDLGIANRGAKATTDLYVVRETVGTTILIEWCFIDNADDMKKFRANKAKAINSVLAILGYKGTASAPAPAKAQYWDKTGWYEVLKDDTFYTSTAFSDNSKSGWKLAKGSRFYVDEVTWNPSKNARRGAVLKMGNSGKRYFSLNKAIVKKI